MIPVCLQNLLRVFQPDSDSSSSWESEIDFTRGELCRRWGSQAGCTISPPNDVMLGKLIEYEYYRKN